MRIRCRNNNILTYCPMFKKYLDYIRDNPHGYWFKRKPFGWGWTPVKWQGWLVILVYIVPIMILAFNREKTIPGNPDS